MQGSSSTRLMTAGEPDRFNVTPSRKMIAGIREAAG
jgi:hypothetical protein